MTEQKKPPQDLTPGIEADDDEVLEEPEQTSREAPAKPGVKSSAVGVAIIALALLAGVMDRVVPPGPRAFARITPESPGGVLACPFFYAGNGRSWLHLANAGAKDSKITVTTVRGGKDKLLFKTLTVKPGYTATVQIDQSVKSEASAIVEYAGGDVAASRTSVFAVGEQARGGVAAPCVRAGDRTLIGAAGTTLNAESSLWLLNPSTSDAVADVSLLAGGEESTPEALKSFIIKARDRRKIRLGDFAFDQKNVAPVVRVQTGVVAADLVLSSVNGITLTPATPPRELMAGIAAADGGTVLTDVVALGEANSVSDASVMTVEGQSIFSALAQDLEPSSPITVSPVDKKTPVAGVKIALRDGSPIAAALRWLVKLPNGNSDIAAGLMGEPSQRLVAVSGDPAGSQQSRVLLANPSEGQAVVRLSLLTPEGRRPAGTIPDIVLEPGTALSVPIGTVKGAFAIQAESSQTIVMTLSSTVVGRADVSSFSVAGLPPVSSQTVGIENDPRLGIPVG